MDDQIRVVIVDDHSFTRTGLRALLSLSPDVLVVGEAEDGSQALEVVGNEQPDVVLMDVQMPRMTGLEATQRIKRRWPRVKVILHTVSSAYEQEAEAVGADRFLVKGCTPHALVEAIRALKPADRSLIGARPH